MGHFMPAAERLAGSVGTRPPPSCSSLPVIHRLTVMAQLGERLNPWVFLVGLLLALIGSGLSVNIVIQGSVKGGSYTYIALGPALVLGGVILMTVCYVTRRS